MSPLFRQSNIDKFTPKSIKFSKLYHSNTAGGKLSDNVLSSVKQTLAKSGYSDAQIASMITADSPLPVNEMKKIAGVLNQHKIYGFEKDPDRAVKHFLNGERVKAQSIAGIRKEHILEAGAENLAKAGTTSLNSKAVGPNSAKDGPASALARRRGPNAVFSLSGQAQADKTESLLQHGGSTAIPRPGMSSTGSTKGGITIKPKF